MVILALAPSAIVIAPDAVPDDTTTPFTVTIAMASLVVGVTLTLATLLKSQAVKVVIPIEKTGVSVPLLNLYR